MFNFVKRFLTKLNTRGGHHRNYTSLADKRKVRRRFLCFSEDACSFVKRSRICTTTCRSESEGASFRNRRGACSEIEEAPIFQKAGFAGSKRLSTRVKEWYHHLLLSLYMSTFIFYGKENLKKMPNSPSPLRAHSQQSLSKYSIFSPPKKIPETWSTNNAEGNGRSKHVETTDRSIFMRLK